MASMRLVKGPSVISSLALLIVCVGFTIAGKTTIIDDEGIESIAHSVCEGTMGTHKQISRISTIYQLVAFFKDLSPEHKLSRCGERSSEALLQLYQLVSTSSENVCSEEKLGLIEQFHHDYVTRTWKDDEEPKDKALRLLVQFFMHYANQVGITCKVSLVLKYKIDGNEIVSAEEAANRDKIDQMLKDFSYNLGATPSKTYGDVVLLWNQIDRIRIRDDNDYINDGGAKRVTFKAYDPEPMQKFQIDCIQRLRPIYGPSALPVIRLIDLGYYVDGESFVEQLAQNQDLKRLFNVAQLCEFMLKVRVVKDDSLKAGDMVLIYKEEASQIPEEPKPEIDPRGKAISDAFDHNTLNDDTLSSVNPDDASNVVKILKANIKTRNSYFRSMMRTMTKQMKNKAKALFGKLFYSKKSANQRSFEKQDASSLVDESLNELSTEVDSTHDSEKGLTRRRRSLLTSINIKDDFSALKEKFKKNVILGILIAFGLLIKWFILAILTVIGQIANVICSFIKVMIAGNSWCIPPKEIYFH